MTRAVRNALGDVRPRDTLLATCMLLLCGPAVAQLPAGASVVAGSVTISQTGSTQQIVQGSDKAIIDWRSFSIGAGHSVAFAQPSAASIALNRVVGTEASSIFGALTANGQIFLVNPNGVYFGRGAVLDTAGLLATTLAIRNEDFLAGRYLFQRPADAAEGATVRNEGLLRARDGGYVVLAGDRVENAGGGRVEARLGTVALAAGGRITLDVQGDRLINFSVDAATTDRLANVLNLGELTADGGRVLMSAMAARDATGTVVNNGGLVRAAGIDEQGGEIILTGNAGEVRAGGTLAADGGRGGRITVRAGEGSARIAGSLSATGKTAGGGALTVTGERVAVAAGSQLDASGASAGGTVLIGGDAHGTSAGAPNARLTTVDAGATIAADARDRGDGGKIVVWADETTRFAGTISARGGPAGGDGGWVEVSGKRNLSLSGDVDTSAAQGRTGSLLLDPATINITDGASGSGASDTELDAGVPAAAPAGQVLAADGGAVGFTISRGKIELLGASNNINLEATGLISIADLTGAIGGINITGVGRSFTLRSTTSGGITFADPNDEIRTNGGAISLLAQGTGTITGLGKLSSNGGDITVLANDLGLTVGRAINAAAGSVTITTGEATAATQTMAINAAVTGGTVKLDAADGITQGAGGVITANNLVVRYALGTNPDTALLTADNAVGTLAATVTGTGVGAGNGFSFRNAAATALQVGTVDGITGISSKGDTISLFADTLDIAQTVDARGGGNVAAAVVLSTAAAGRAIRLGNENAGALSLTQAELNLVHSGGLLRIGDLAAGGITLAGAIAPGADWDTLSFKTAGGITQNGGATLSVRNVAVDAGGAITLASTATGPGTVALKGSGAIAYTYGSAGAGNLTVSAIDGVTGVVSGGNAITLSSAGSLALGAGGSVNAGAGSVALVAGGAGLTQQAGADVTAAGLQVSGTGGSFALTNAGNSFSTLAASTAGPLSVTSAIPLTIGSVTVGGSTINGITAAGANVTLTADALSVNQNIITGGGAAVLRGLSAATVTNLGVGAKTGAPLTLELTATEIGRILAGTGGITFGDAAINGAITVASALNVAGTTPVTLTNGSGGIALNAKLTAGGNVALTSGGTVADAGGGSGVTAPALDITAVGGIGLTGSGNSFASLSLANSGGGNIAVSDTRSGLSLLSASQAGGGSVTLSNTGTLSLTAAPLAADGGNISLSAGGAMTLQQDIAAGVANLKLNAGGGVLQNAGIITASGLELTGTGDFLLTNVKSVVAGPATDFTYNNVGTLAANITGDLAWHDQDALAIGTVGATTGITTNGGSLSLTSGGPARTGGAALPPFGGTLTLASNLSAGAGIVTLTVNNAGISQTGGAITGSTLNVTSGGAATLNQAGNNLSTVAIAAQGAVDFRDTDAVTVGGSGISSGGNAVDLTTGGLLTLTQNVNAGGATVTLNSAAGASQTGGAILGGSLRVLGSGPYTLSQTGNNVATLAGSFAGDLSYRDANALTVGTVGGTVGVTSTTGGSIDLRTVNGSLTINQDVSSPGAPRGDVVLVAGGAFPSTPALTLNANVIGKDVQLVSEGTLTQAPAPNTSVVDVSGELTMGAKNNPTTAVTRINGAVAPAEIVRIFDSDTPAGDYALPVTANRVVFYALDGTPVNYTGVITAPVLALYGAASFNLSNTSNQTQTLGAARGSLLFGGGRSISYVDSDSFAVGAPLTSFLGTVSGINNNSSAFLGGGNGTDVRLQALSGAIALDRPIATGGLVALDSPGGTTQAVLSTISAGSLKLVGAGNFVLSRSNSVGTLAASVTNSSALNFVNAGDLTVGFVDGLSGIGLTGPGSTSISLRSTGGDLDITQAVTTTSGGGANPNPAAAAISLRAYDDLRVSANVLATGGSAAAGDGASVALRADIGGVFQSAGLIRAIDNGGPTAAASAPHRAAVSVRAAANSLDAGTAINNFFDCFFNGVGCSAGEVTLRTVTATSGNGSAVIDVFAPRGLSTSGTLTATGQTAPRINLTGDLQNTSKSLISSANLSLGGNVLVSQPGGADVNTKGGTETAGLLISGNSISATGTLTSNSAYGISITAQNNITFANDVSTTANDGISLSTASTFGTVSTSGTARVTAKQIGLTGDRDKGIFKLATDIETLQVLGARALTIDNSVHTGMLVATVVGRVSPETTDPSSGQVVPAVDKPVGAVKITTGGDLTTFSMNNQSTQSYDLDGSQLGGVFLSPKGLRPLTLIANRIVETPGAFTLDANTEVTLRPFTASREIVVRNQPGSAADAFTTYSAGIAGLLNQFNPDARLVIGGPGYTGNISVGSQSSPGVFPSSEQLSLGRMEVAFQTTGRVFNRYSSNPDSPTNWSSGFLLTPPYSPSPAVFCPAGQACIARISSNKIFIKDSYSNGVTLRDIVIDGQGTGVGGFTPPSGSGGSTGGSSGGGGGGSSSSGSGGSSSSDPTPPSGDPGGGGDSGTPGGTSTTVVVTTTTGSAGGGSTPVIDTGTGGGSADATAGSEILSPDGGSPGAGGGGSLAGGGSDAKSGPTGTGLAGAGDPGGGSSGLSGGDPTAGGGGPGGSTGLAGDPSSGTTGSGFTGGDGSTGGSTGLAGDPSGGSGLPGDGTSPGGGATGGGLAGDGSTGSGTSGDGGSGLLAGGGDGGSGGGSSGFAGGGDGGSGGPGGDGALAGGGAGGTGGAGGDGSGSGLSGGDGAGGSGLLASGDGGSGGAGGSGFSGGSSGSGSDGALAGGATGGATGGAGDGGGGGDGGGLLASGDGGTAGAGGSGFSGDGSGGGSGGGLAGDGALAGGDSGSGSAGGGIGGDGAAGAGGSGFAGGADDAGKGGAALADGGDGRGTSGSGFSGGGTGDGDTTSAGGGGDGSRGSGTRLADGKGTTSADDRLEFVGGGEGDAQINSGTQLALAEPGDGAGRGTAPGGSGGSTEAAECAADRNQQTRTVSGASGRPLVAVRGAGIRLASGSCGDAGLGDRR